jgi:hypothetical protein
VVPRGSRHPNLQVSNRISMQHVSFQLLCQGSWRIFMIPCFIYQ